jgi:hypothetical protein
MTKEAMKLALDAVLIGFKAERFMTDADYALQDKAVLVLQEALAEPTSADYAMGYAEGFNDACKPAQRQARSADTWVGLSDEDVMSIAFNFDVSSLSLVAKAIEAKLKELNT